MARTSRETWSKRVEKWKTSGLTAAEFAAKIGVSASSLSWWKWQLGSQRRKLAAKGRRSRSKAGTAAVSPLTFVEMSAAVRGEPFEIVLASGSRIRVPVDFDVAALERLVQALDKHR